MVDYEKGAQKLKQKVESGVIVPAKSISVSTGFLTSTDVKREEFPPCGFFAPSVSVEVESRPEKVVIAEAQKVETQWIHKYATETRELIQKERAKESVASSLTEGDITVYVKTDEKESAAVEKKQPQQGSGDLPFFTVCNDTILDLVVVVIQDANAQVLTSQASYSRDMRTVGNSASIGASTSALGEIGGSLSVSRKTENESESSFAAQMAFANKVDDKQYVVPGSEDAKQRRKVKFDTTVFMPVAATRNCEIIIQSKDGADVGHGKKNVSSGKRIVLTLDPHWQAETSMLAWS